LGVFGLADLSPDDIFGFRIEVVKQERRFKAGKRRNLIIECIEFLMARFRNRRCLLLIPRDIRLGLVAWDGMGLFGGIQVIVKGEKGRTKGNNVKIERILKAITVNYQARSIEGDFAMAGLRDPAKTRLEKSRRSPRPRRGGSIENTSPLNDGMVVRKLVKPEEDGR
jgi:hypothetical protein